MIDNMRDNNEIHEYKDRESRNHDDRPEWARKDDAKTNSDSENELGLTLTVLTTSQSYRTKRERNWPPSALRNRRKTRDGKRWRLGPRKTKDKRPTNTSKSENND